MIRPVFSTDPMQPNQTRLTPVYSSGPMQPRPDVESFDLTRNSVPTRSLVTGDRSLTRNPNGRMGAPQLDAMGDRIGSRGMTPLRRMEIAARRGDMRANETLLRAQAGMGGFGPRGYGQPQAARQGYGAPQPPPTSANPNQPLPPALDPLANLPPPATTEEALGMPSAGAPGEGKNSQAQQPLMPQRMPWEGQPLPGGVPMRPAFAPMPWEPQETFDTTQPLPPSTLMGGAGLPPPPAYSEQQVGGFNVLTGPDGQGGSKFLNAYTDPNRGAPPPLNTRELQTAAANKVEHTGQFDASGLPILKPTGPSAPPRIQSVSEGDVKTNVQWNAAKNRWERVKIYNPGDPDDNGIPGDQRLAAAATPGAAWRSLGGR